MTITARVASLSNTNSSAKAGVMMRDGLTNNARNVFAFVTPTAASLCRFQARSATGGNSTSASGGSGAVPVWVRLVRSGNNFTGFCSTDGTSWTQIGATTTIAMPSALSVGMAVTSHAGATLVTGILDSIFVTTS